MRIISFAFCLAFIVAPSVQLQAGAPKPQPNKKTPAAQQVVTDYLACLNAPDGKCMEVTEKLRKNAEAACPLLAAEFENADEELKAKLADKLGEFKCKEGVAAAVKYLSSEDGENRGEVAVGLSKSGAAPLVEPTIALLRTGRPFDKEKACEALANLRNATAVPALVAATQESMFAIRMQAALALGKFPGPDSRAALCSLHAQDVNPGVRVNAAMALGEQKDIEAIPCLAKGLEDRIGTVQNAAYEALKATAGLDLGMASEPWTLWYERNKPVKRR
jgi:HEAT repeat protein